MAFAKSILFRRERTWLVAAIMIAALIGVTLTSLLSIPAPSALAAAPTMTAVASDENADGTIDQIIITFSELSDVIDGNAGDGLASLALGNGCTIPNSDYAANSTNTLTLSNLTGCTAGNTSLTPSVTYTAVANCSAAGAICDDALANQMANAETTNATDGAAPVIKRFWFNDSDLDGRLDQLSIFFTETVTAASVLSANDLTFSNVGDFTGVAFGMDGTDLITGSVSSINLTLGTEATVQDTSEDSGNIAFSTQNSFSLTDGTNVNNTLGAQAQTVFLDNMGPVISDFSYEDADGDGKIDRVTLTYSETLDAVSFLSANDLTFSNVGDFTGAAFGTDGTDLITGSVTSTTIIFGTEATAVDTSEDSGNIAITSQNNFSIDDGSNVNDVLGAQSVSSFTDGAAPVVVSVSPTENISTVSTTANIVITFSEAMDTTFVEGGEFAVSPDPGSFATTTWTSSDTVATIDLNTALLCATTYTVTTAEGSIDAAAGSPTGLATTGPEDGDWSFTTRCSSSSGGGTTAAKTYTVGLTSHDDGTSVTAGSTQTITWTTGGTGESSFVNVLYSTDGGASYTAIVTNLANTGSTSWVVPNLTSDEVKIRIETTDLAEALAVDVSTLLFSITLESVEAPSEEVTAPATDQTGVSPITGEIEAISEVNAGDYITSPGFSTVYYIDSSMMRHPFFNNQTFFTWQDSFATVKTVTDATLTTLELGAPMLPKVAVVLIKIQSDPKVYAVTSSDDIFMPTLRWVTSESLAIGIYGAEWADYIIDIPVTLFGRFGFGEDVTSVNDLTVNLDSMKKRVDLN